MLIFQQNFILNRLKCSEFFCLSFDLAELGLNHRLYFENSASACLDISLGNLLVLPVYSELHHWVNVPLIADPGFVRYVVGANWSRHSDNISELITELGLSKFFLWFLWIIRALLFKEWRPQKYTSLSELTKNVQSLIQKAFFISPIIWLLIFLKVLLVFSAGIPSW